MNELTNHIDIILSILVPLGGFLIFLTRHFWKKEQCFIRMRDAIDRLTDEQNNHKESKSRITTIESDIAEIKIYLRQLLQKNDIPYD